MATKRGTMTNYWTRRRVLSTGGTVAAGAAGLALVGCGGDAKQANGSKAAPGSPTVEPVTRGGTLRLPINGYSSGPFVMA